MRLFADSIAASAGLADAHELVRHPARTLPGPLQHVWRRLVGDADAWTAPLRSSRAPAAPQRVLVAVEHAAASQFTALQTALRDAAPLPDDLACIALEGNGFRGQRGRAWEALRGNLHVSLLARLDLPAASVQTALTALPAVAAARAIERASRGRVRPGLKWVNDLLLDEHKVAGVLSATHVQGDRAAYALVGIGINVERAPSLARDPRVPPAGSLRALVGSACPTLEALTVVLVEELDRAIMQVRSGDGRSLVDAYRRRSLMVGRQVAIWPISDGDDREAPLLTGRVRALRADLGLELEGHGEPVLAGRLTFLDGANHVEHDVVEDG